jgi:RNA polymerase sigma-70 factor (ECF subfamily)
MSAPALEELDARLWDLLDCPWSAAPGSGKSGARSSGRRAAGVPSEGSGWDLSPWAALELPDAAARWLELCLQHVLLREVFQEEEAVREGAGGPSDAELVRQAEGGVPGAWEVLVARYSGLVIGAAYSVLADAESARDVAQEAFLEAARTLPLLREREKFGHWVYGIARRKAIYVLRKRKKRREAEADFVTDAEQPQAEPGQPLARRERREHVRASLAQLPEIYREILVLKYLDGRSYGEIGRLLGLNQTAVDKRLTRAKALLREALRTWSEE